jgi:uncharacterized membrane protein
MKFAFKTEILPILLIIASVILGFYFYSVMPEQVPIHWNFKGAIDNYGSRFTGAFIGPIVLIGLYLLFILIPLIDPRKEKYEQFAKIYRIVRCLIMLAMFGVFLIASLNAIGYNIKVEVWIPAIIGFLFIVMGNYFGKIKPNWFMGIRTPWTLSSDEVWNKTHRLGGKLFMLFGFLLLITPLLPTKSLLWTLLIPVAVVSLIPIVYSYILYKKIKNRELSK